MSKTIKINGDRVINLADIHTITWQENRIYIFLKDEKEPISLLDEEAKIVCKYFESRHDCDRA